MTPDIVTATRIIGPMVSSVAPQILENGKRGNGETVKAHVLSQASTINK